MSCVIISFVVLLLGMFSVSCLAETENVANELHRLEQKHNVTIQLPSYLNEEECYDELERIDTFLTSNPLVIRVMIESVSTAVNDAVENEKTEGVEPRKPVTVTKSGTASVWCGIPSIGFGYIKTPFTVKYTASGGLYTINSCTLMPSYGDGWTWGQFIFYDNWWDSDDGFTLEVNARGQLSYSIGVSTILTDLQTFLDTIDLVTL